MVDLPQITSLKTASFVQEMAQGVHNLETDTLKCALYYFVDPLVPTPMTVDTTAYTATNEVSGSGYTAGGVTVSQSGTLTKEGSFWVQRLSNIVFPSVTVSADEALLYNSSQDDKAIAVIRFGALMSTTNADFTIRFAQNVRPILSFKF